MSNNTTTNKEKIPFTKAVKDNRLNTKDMEVGSCITGEVIAVTENNYGDAIVTMLVNKRTNQTVDIKPSGNLKFVFKDMLTGKRPQTGKLFIMRKDDRMFNGRATTQFATKQEGYTPAKRATTSVTTAAPSKPASTPNLDEIRARIKGGVTR